jgi:hypothetical protein
MKWREDFCIPGTPFRVSGLLMVYGDHEQLRYILEWVLERAGIESVRLVAEEIKRKRQAHAKMIGDFMGVYSTTGSVDAAMQGVLAPKGSS